jgi:hypothetical protein
MLQSVITTATSQGCAAARNDDHATMVDRDATLGEGQCYHRWMTVLPWVEGEAPTSDNKYCEPWWRHCVRLWMSLAALVGAGQRSMAKLSPMATRPEDNICASRRDDSGMVLALFPYIREVWKKLCMCVDPRGHVAGGGSGLPCWKYAL